MRVCVDAQNLIWLLRAWRNDQRYENDLDVKRARRWSEQLAAEAAELLIPAPVLAEYLVGVDTPRRIDTWRKFQHRFEIVPFGAKQAHIVAEIWPKIYEPEEGAKQRQKVDIQVVACAIGAPSDVLCSHDKGQRAKARAAGLPVYDMAEDLRRRLGILAEVEVSATNGEVPDPQ